MNAMSPNLDTTTARQIAIEQLDALEKDGHISIPAQHFIRAISFAMGRKVDMGEIIEHAKLKRELLALR